MNRIGPFCRIAWSVIGAMVGILTVTTVISLVLAFAAAGLTTMLG
jgi:hypothetical protein